MTLLHPAADSSGFCANSGSREVLSTKEAMAGMARCSRCGRMLKLRVRREAEGDSAEATIPKHKPVTP